MEGATGGRSSKIGPYDFSNLFLFGQLDQSGGDNPGFGHQHFIHTTLPKIQRVRQMIEKIKAGCDLEVYGGVDAETAPLAVTAGANVLVAGSSIFGESEGVRAAMGRLRAGIQLWEKLPQRV